MVRRRVILADDHNIVRQGMAALLAQSRRYDVIGQATDGEEVLELVAEASDSVDLVILDLAMPRLSGLEVIARLRKRRSRVKILVLSMYDDPQFVARALRLGANGYLLKHAMDEELFEAMEAVLAGEQYVSSAVDMGTVLQFTMEDSNLTSRERQVLQLIAEGFTTADLAAALHISPHTATRHRANLMRKLSVHNRVDLIRVGVQRGLIVLPQGRQPGGPHIPVGQSDDRPASAEK